MFESIMLCMVVGLDFVMFYVVKSKVSFSMLLCALIFLFLQVIYNE